MPRKSELNAEEKSAMKETARVTRTGIKTACPVKIEELPPMKKPMGREMIKKAYTHNLNVIEPTDDALAMIEMIKNRRTHETMLKRVETLDDLNGVIDAYWNYLDDARQKGQTILPDWEGFCSYAGRSREVFDKWLNEDYKGMGDTLMTIKNDIAAVKNQQALAGKTHPVIWAAQMNNNHGYVQRPEKQEINITYNNIPDRESLIAESKALLGIEEEE